MREVEYKGLSKDVDIYCDAVSELIPGTYYVDIYTEGNKIGTSNFVLK